jgi:hypothetical protein
VAGEVRRGNFFQENDTKQCEDTRLFHRSKNQGKGTLTLSNQIFLPPAYSPALNYFGLERGYWITCNYPTDLKKKNRNRKSTPCAICWLKSILHEEKRREKENHNVGRSSTL